MLYNAFMNRGYARIAPGARLNAIIELTGRSDTVADIGCDHGRLGAALLQCEKARHVIATDISAMSLEKGKRLAQKCGLGEKMSFFEGSGLEPLARERIKADTAVIAGMGGELIAEIMAAEPEIAKSIGAFILQPMRGIEKLRLFLRENGYAVTNERIVFEGGRYYQVIKCCFGGETPKLEGFPEGMLYIGEKSVINDDPLLRPMLEKRRGGHIKRIEKARANGAELSGLEKEVRLIDAVLKIAEDKK